MYCGYIRVVCDMACLRSSAPLSKRSSTTVSVRVDPAAVGRTYSRRRLRSASTAAVLVPATRRNNLPVDLRLSRTFSTFKTHLKSHLFNISFPSVWLYHWLLFAQSPWSRLCCIHLFKFVTITLHYIIYGWVEDIRLDWPTVMFDNFLHQADGARETCQTWQLANQA